MGVVNNLHQCRKATLMVLLVCAQHAVMFFVFGNEMGGRIRCVLWRVSGKGGLWEIVDLCHIVWQLEISLTLVAMFTTFAMMMHTILYNRTINTANKIE